MLRIDCLTVFPRMFAGVFDEGVIARARRESLISVNVHDLRDFTSDQHRKVDDEAYGGGPGMVFKPEPIFRAAEEIVEPEARHAIVLLCPTGQELDQALAAELAEFDQLLLIAGRYEGVDERVRDQLATHVVRIGNYVLTGGELPAMVLVDAVARLVPGVVGNQESVVEDSFTSGLLDHPHYTRPAEFRGQSVPDVLLSGDHERIRLWRRRTALSRTLETQPELLERAALTAEDRRLLREIRNETTTTSPTGGQHA